MVAVDRRIIVLSSKRSTHHAFLEGLLQGKRYTYDNNVTVTKTGALDINRTTSSDEPADAPLVYVASFERRYRLPDLYRTDAYRELLDRHTSPEDPQRVIYLRDPLNTIASTYSAHLKTDYFANFSYVTVNVAQWVDLARYVLDGGGGETFVYANRFLADDAYRTGCLEALGFGDYRLSEKLSRFGGGGNTYLQDKKAAITPDALESRYLTYATDEKYLALIRENRALFLAFCAHVGDERMTEAVGSL